MCSSDLQRQRPDAGRGTAGQRRHPDQQRQRHPASAGSRSFRHKQSVRLRVLRTSRTAGLCLAGHKLVARDLRDMVEIVQDGLQFAAERDAALTQIRCGFEQVLVSDDLTRGGEQ